MAATICNVLTVQMPAFNNATAAADRTYTTTRQLRLCDLKILHIGNAIAAGPGVTVSNGATTCITLTALGAAAGTVQRLGQNAADTVDDAQMVVAAGNTVVFASTTADTTQAFLYAWPL